MKALIFLLFLLLISCQIDKPEKNEYEPFKIQNFPEERVFYPEEKITFVFNMDVNPNSLKGFSATEKDSKEELPVEVEGETVSILPPLPARSSISVTITSALKSFDNKPLMTSEGFSENKETIQIVIPTGTKLPEVESIIPSETKSATVAIRFDSFVEVKFKDVEPVPFDMMKIDSWLVFIYEKPVKDISISNVKALEREALLEKISVSLPSKEPVKSEISVKYSATDAEITVEITDESAVAVSLNGVNAICEKKCAATIKDLKPETFYSLKTNVYTTTGIKSDSADITTGEERPRIMISEVMHTPALEPEKNWEFVEIFNHGNLDFDLTDCFIDDKNDGKGIDPLILKDPARELILKPGELAVITGNEAAFSDIIGNALWLAVDDTTIADAGLTSTETVQIICKRDGSMVMEASANPPELKTVRGYSFNVDRYGSRCSSENVGGTPGKYYECK